MSDNSKARSGKSVLAVIPDGYTESAYVAAVPALHPAIRFEYRPMRATERAVYIKEVERAEGSAYLKARAAWLKTKIVSWDVKDAKGIAWPIEIAEILLLKQAVQDRLFEIVCNLKPGDDDPDAPAEQNENLDEDVAAIKEAAAAGVPLAVLLEERQKKISNSAR